MKPEKIIKLVCDKLGVSNDELTYRSRSREIVEARQYCFFLIHATEPLSYREIAEPFNMDRTTIMSGIKTLQNRMDTEPDLSKSVYELLKIIEDYDESYTLPESIIDQEFQENDFYTLNEINR